VINILNNHYSEKHRHYHNANHINNLLNKVIVYKDRLSNKEFLQLQVAILFHDVIYDPRSKKNEEESSKLFLKTSKHLEALDSNDIHIIDDLILSTKNHEPKNLLEKIICKLDLSSFSEPFSQILIDEKKIRKEYQFVDWVDYQKGRIDILDKFKNKAIIQEMPGAKEKIDFQIEYLKQEKPKIAIYPGSFSPLHVGHLNILEKGEQVFDKVILAFGRNTEKISKDIEDDLSWKLYKIELNEKLKYRQVEFYNNSLVEYLDSKPYDVPEDVVEDLLNADSKGSFHYHNIAYTYPYVKIGSGIKYKRKRKKKKKLVSKKKSNLRSKIKKKAVVKKIFKTK